MVTDRCKGSNYTRAGAWLLPGTAAAAAVAGLSDKLKQHVAWLERNR
jgi:hypothetical protein